MESIILFYQYIIYFYALAITIIYIALAMLGFINIRRKKGSYTLKEEQLFTQYPDMAPPISIVAPAFNEEVIIIDNVSSLLKLDYPNFEVVVVNDGSKDKTLELLIERFELQEIPFEYLYKVPCHPVKRIFKSTNPAYNRLTVIDKENGGTKADAMNAGVNYIKNDYFINTDVDCILAKDTLKKIILPVLDSDIPVIGVGATLRMANSCIVENGEIKRVSPPSKFIPTFQETEYLRSYVVAKMGWGLINCIPNISGGFGLFSRAVVTSIGGFDTQSHAEDMDMTIRMSMYMHEQGKKFKIEQIPDSCCWTEGPPNIKVLKRQRTRWGRGLAQIFFVHRKLILNYKYGKLGLVVLPYALFFEFIAPIVESIGVVFMIYLLVSQQINFATFWLMLLFVYLIGITISIITITYDLTIKKQYNTFKEYLRLVFFSCLESFFYHPFVVVFSLLGYWQFISGRKIKWGEMKRQGFNNPKK